MFSKILIANRGEIALRIIRSAKELGIKTVAVFSEPDRKSLHTIVADEKICIGPRKASESYLNIPRIMSAVEITQADAIHPGYGFLAENPRFPEICENSGITFIGPPSSIIKLMGDKNRARQEMKKARLPIIPGSDTIIEDLLEAKKVAKKIGYPIILKAVAGGGGKGMRVAHSAADLDKQFPIAQNEAKAAFGNPSLYLERFIQASRHIEIQVIGDQHGNIFAFAERECSIQRKHQKLIEETPSPFIDEKTRRKMVKAAHDATKAIGYQSLGTFEFLVDERKKFYPEMKPRGHSMECRINAEDAETFIPSPGKIDFLILPGGQGVRVDSAAYRGWEIPPDYDSLVAKIIVHASNREETIQKMQTALESTSIGGIKSNISLQLKILANADFQKGEFSTQFMDKFLSKVKKEDIQSPK